MTAFTKTSRTRTGVRSQGQLNQARIFSGLVAGATGFMAAGAIGNFERWPSGSLYVSNGLDPIRSWNGVRGSFVPVGLGTPVGTPVLAGSGSGTITGSYQCYVRFYDEDLNFSPLSPASVVVTFTTNLTVTYTGLPTPTDPRIVGRQILRNTAGQFTTFYVDVDTTDVWSATLTSTLTDITLAAQDSVPLFDDNRNSLTDIWSAPRTDKPILAHHRGRMFAAGEVIYDIGNSQVAFGSVTVTGIGTAWTASMVGRQFFVIGSAASYLIDAVDVVNQTLTLHAPYRGLTDLFVKYGIQPERDQKNTVYFSQADQPAQWNPTDGFVVEEAGEAITALIGAAAYLYIGFRDALYRYTFDSDPSTDGSSFRVATRGCVNNRTWARINETFYVLDRQGIYFLDASAGQTKELAQAIRNLWSKEAGGEFKIDWTYEAYFHASLDTVNATVRFFVSLSGPCLPHHAICYNYVTNSWWIEEFAFPVTCSFWQASETRLFVGGAGFKLYEMGVGTVDGLNPTGYQTRYVATSSTRASISCLTMLLPASGVVGSPVTITFGTGRGQTRIIDSVSGTTLNVTQPWLVQPDITTEFQIGGIPWRIRSGWYQFVPADQRQTIEAFFEPSVGRMSAVMYANHSATPVLCAGEWPVSANESDGLSWTDQSPFIDVDLSQSTGYIRSFVSTASDSYQKHGNLVSLEVSGVSTPSGVLIYSFNIGGAV